MSQLFGIVNPEIEITELVLILLGFAISARLYLKNRKYRQIQREQDEQLQKIEKTLDRIMRIDASGDIDGRKWRNK